MAASGLPLGASLEGEHTTAGPTDYPAASQHTPAPSSSASPYAPSSSAPSSAPAAAVFAAAASREHAGSNDGSAGGTPTAAAGSSASLAAEPLAVQSLLGFIKTRKLAGVARQPPSRRSSSGSTASAHGGAGGSSAGSAATAAAGGIAAQGRKVWIQPSGELLPTVCDSTVFQHNSWFQMHRTAVWCSMPGAARDGARGHTCGSSPAALGLLQANCRGTPRSQTCLWDSSCQG
jgi:hypothetical protein